MPELEHVLSVLERKLKEINNPALPVVTLSTESRFGSPKIAWCFATVYDVVLDVAARRGVPQ